MGWARTGRSGTGGGGLWLSLLALLAIVLVPPGYMVGQSAGQGGPELVICSGHGPLALHTDAAGHPVKPSKAGADTPCAFAGHGVASSVAPVAAPMPRTAWFLVPVIGRLGELTPGRGLAAPPPPAQAPPAASRI